VAKLIVMRVLSDVLSAIDPQYAHQLSPSARSFLPRFEIVNLFLHPISLKETFIKIFISRFHLEMYSLEIKIRNRISMILCTLAELLQPSDKLRS
jgi:hypothetical protein